MRRTITTITVLVALALTAIGSATAAATSARGQLIVFGDHAVSSLSPSGGRLHRLFSTPAKLMVVAASQTGGVVAGVDFAHGWGYPDTVAYSIEVSDLHGRRRRSLGYGSSVQLSSDGKWAAISGWDISCNKVAKSETAPNPCNSLTVIRTDGSQKRVFDGFQSQVVAWSRDDSQLAVVHYVNRKLSRLEFITRNGRRVGKTFVLPLGDGWFVQQGFWVPGRLVLSTSSQFQDGELFDINTTTGKVWSREVPSEPYIWLSPGGSSAVLGGVLSYPGDPGGVPGGGFIADTLADYSVWGAASDKWVNQQADKSSIPPLHPLYVSKKPFEVIGWTA